MAPSVNYLRHLASVIPGFSQGKRDVSFSKFDYQTGLDVFGGLRFRRGTFAKVNASLWAEVVPTLRLIFGYF
jgi:hypothetical protein